MAICTVIKQGDLLVVTADSAVMKEKEGVNTRVGTTADNILRYKDDYIYLSGYLQCVLETRNYIVQNGLDDLENYLKINDYPVFIAIINKESITTFNMKDHEKEVNPFEDNQNTIIKTYGYEEERIKFNEALQANFKKAEEAEEKMPMELTILESYKDVSCGRVGGFLNIYYPDGTMRTLDIDSYKFNIYDGMWI
jgi:hypothetical protein